LNGAAFADFLWPPQVRTWLWDNSKEYDSQQKTTQKKENCELGRINFRSQVKFHDSRNKQPEAYEEKQSVDSSTGNKNTPLSDDPWMLQWVQKQEFLWCHLKKSTNMM
jgi:hypothetical protein